MKNKKIAKCFFGKPMNYRSTNPEAVAKMGTIREDKTALKLLPAKNLSSFSKEIQAFVQSIPNWSDYDDFVVDGTHYITALSEQKDVVALYTYLEPKDFKTVAEMRALQMRYNQTTRTTLRDNYLTIIDTSSDAATIAKDFDLSISTAHCLTTIRTVPYLVNVLDGELLFLPQLIELVQYCIATKCVNSQYTHDRLQILVEDGHPKDEPTSKRWREAFERENKEVQKAEKEAKKAQQLAEAKLESDAHKKAFDAKLSDMIDEGIDLVLLVSPSGKNQLSTVEVQADNLSGEDKQKGKMKKVFVKDYEIDAKIVFKRIDDHRLYPAGTLFINGFVRTNREEDLCGLMTTGEVVPFVLLQNKVQIAKEVVESMKVDIIAKKEITGLQKIHINTVALMEQHTVDALPSMQKLLCISMVESMSLPRMGNECVYSAMAGRLKIDIKEDKIATPIELVGDDRFITLQYACANKRNTTTQPNSMLAMVFDAVEADLKRLAIIRLEEGFAVSHTGFSNPKVLNSIGNELSSMDDMTEEEQEAYYLRYIKSLEDQEQQDKELKNKQPSKSSKKRKQ